MSESHSAGVECGYLSEEHDFFDLPLAKRLTEQEQKDLRWAIAVLRNEFVHPSEDEPELVRLASALNL